MSVAQNFEKLLTDFFALYHPRQVKKVGAIVQEFKGQEVSVLKSLCDKYKKSYNVIPGLAESLQAPAPVVEAPAQIEAAEEPELTEEAVSSEEVVEEEVETESTSEEEVAEEEKDKE